MKQIYPKNKEHFKKLILFAKKIIQICKDNKIDSIIYGGFAHFYHTKDTGMKVNDIDIMIPNHKKNFPKLVKILKKNKIKFKYYPQWQTLIIKKGKLRVEFDSVGLGYKKIKEKTLFKRQGHDKADFYGLDVKLLKLNQLEEMYPIAYNRSHDNKVKIMKKIKHLEKFLGRKLK